jgi:tetratricopeptide (TPR) repeat protein
MGKVYLARNGQRVALKVLHPHLLESQEAVERFRREAEVGQRVQHDNVVRTLDVGSAVIGGSTHHYLVMEYVEGQTLRGLLKELGRVPEELCRHIGREIAKGLEAIHAAGVVHRDLKPENVLITEEHVVKVMDLGVARLQDAAFKLSQTGAFLGSVLYAAPEQFRGEAPDSRADFYSLGLVLYELATGKHPFQADEFADVLRRQLQEEPRPAAELNPQLSPFFEEVCTALLEKDRGKRMGFLPADEESEWWGRRARAIRLETRRPLRRIRIPRETALYGRDDELAGLEAVYERTKAGAGRVLLLEGEAGIGKTRLIDEFVGRLQEAGEDVNFLFGSYPPGGAATAAGAFTTAYREELGPEGAAAYLAESPILAPAFDALLRGETAPPGEQPLSTDSLHACFVQVTRALAAESPAVVLIDDLHFAPRDGLALFATLANAVADDRVLLVGTLRPGVPNDWKASLERLEHVRKLEFGRLGADDLLDLLADAFQSERLAKELAGRIAAKSDGNPFFVFEILRGLREGNFISERPDGTWVTTRVIEELEVPPSVKELVQARISALSPDEHDLLEVAACCGYEFDATLVADALEMERIPALRAFGRIERAHRLVRATGSTFSFDHHQVQESLYDGLSEALRTEYHAALGRALERRAGERPDGPTALALAQHFLRAGEARRAGPYAEAAVAHLEQGFIFDEAASLLTALLDAPGVVEGAERFELLVRRNNALSAAGRVSSGQAGLEECVELARRLDDPERLVRAHIELGQWQRNAAEPQPAENNLRRAIELAHEHGLARQEARAQAALGMSLFKFGSRDEGRRLMEEALRYFEQHGPPAIEAAAAANLANVYIASLRPEKARALFERAGGICAETGQRLQAVTLTSSLGHLAFEEGRFAEALRLFGDAVEGARAVGYRYGQASTGIWVARALATMGQNDRAEAALASARVLAREVGAVYLEPYILMCEGMMAENRGDVERAERCYREMLESNRAIGNWEGIASALSLLGELYLRQGRVEEARRYLEETLEMCEKYRPGDIPLIMEVMIATLPGGDPERAVALVKEPRRSAPHERIDALTYVWNATGDLEHLREARRMLQELVDNAPEGCEQSLLHGVATLRPTTEAWERHGDGSI